MLTVSEDEDDLFVAIKSGAQGYLLKNLEAAQLRTDARRGGAGRGGHHPGDGRAHHRGVPAARTAHRGRPSIRRILTR